MGHVRKAIQSRMISKKTLATQWLIDLGGHGGPCINTNLLGIFNDDMETTAHLLNVSMSNYSQSVLDCHCTFCVGNVVANFGLETRIRISAVNHMGQLQASTQTILGPQQVNVEESNDVNFPKKSRPVRD